MTFAPMSPVPPPESPDAAEARAFASEMLARTHALETSADFAWFLAQCVQGEIDRATAKAVSTSATDRERDNAAHIHEAMLRVKSWVSTNLETARAAVERS